MAWSSCSVSRSPSSSTARRAGDEVVARGGAAVDEEVVQVAR